MRIYIHPKCTTCKAAIKFLDKAGARYETVDITEVPPTLKELQAMLGHQGGEVRKLFNTSGMQYREQNLAKKLPGLSEKEALGLLAKNGMLVKRPFLLAGKTGLVGFKEREWKERFPILVRG